MDATVLVAQKNGMYKNSEMCKDCLRKWPKWQSFTLYDWFWIEIQVKQKKLKNSVYESCITVTSSGHNKLLIFIFENCTTVSWDKVAAKSVIY